MIKYGMFLKNGKDLIHITHQNTLKEATQYFADTKQMPVEEFNLWIAYYEIKQDEQQKALNKQKLQGKRG